MATALECDFCDGQRAADVLMTWLSNGATVKVCGECFPPAVTNVLAVNLGADPTRFYQAVQRFLANEAKRQAKEAEKGTPNAAATEPAEGTGEPTHHDEVYPGEHADRAGEMDVEPHGSGDLV